MTASPTPPATTPFTAATGPAPAPWRRLESLDAYRGLTMLLMASNGLGYCFLIPLVGRGTAVQAGTVAAIGLGIWAAFAALHWVIDIRGWQRWAWPLTVKGTNSIAAYMAVALLHRWVRSIARTYLGAATFAGAYGPVLLDFSPWPRCGSGAGGSIDGKNCLRSEHGSTARLSLAA